VIHDQSERDVLSLMAGEPQARILQPGHNLGCAAGWNLAIRHLLHAGVEYIGIWNVDVSVHPDYLSRLVETMERNPTIGACQPVLFYSDDRSTVQMFGASTNIRTGAGRHHYKGSKVSELPSLHDADYLDGGTMLIRADVLRQVGGFDERFFMYAEDSDLCRRIQQAGYRTVAVRDASVWHYHRENRGDFPPPYQIFYETRNRFYFVRKHAGPGAWLVLLARTACEAPRKVLYYSRRRKSRLVQAYLAGIGYGVAGRMGRCNWISRPARASES